MKKRVYQVGITEGFKNNEELNAILRAKDFIILEKGENYWKDFYKELCNKVRSEWNIPYVLNVSPYFEQKDVIGITVFDHVADNNSYYDVYWDEEIEMCYIEIEN